MAMAKQSLGVCGAHAWVGAPRRGARSRRGGGRPARSSSAGRSTDRRVGCRPRRSGSSSSMARPIVSDLRSRPGPLVVVTPRAPPNVCAEGGSDARDLVLGLEGADVELLAPAQLVEDVRRRSDRVAAQEQGQPGEACRRDEAPGQGLVPRHLDVLALLEGGRLDLVVGLEELGRLAEVVAGAERPVRLASAT